MTSSSCCRWIEKSQAEDRTDAAMRRVAELEQQVTAWEHWHHSQRRQQRQRRHQAMRAPPEAMIHNLLAEWGAPSVQSLRLDERHRLAAGLAAAVSALLSTKPPLPPGLMQQPERKADAAPPAP